MVGKPGRPRGLKEQEPGPIPARTPTLADNFPRWRNWVDRATCNFTWDSWVHRVARKRQGRARLPEVGGWETQVPASLVLGTASERLNFPPHWWKEEPEPEIGQIYRTSFKCYFLHTAVFGLRFVPITISNFPTPNFFLAVNNAQCNECFIAFLVLLYKYIHTSRLLWLNRTHALWTPNKEHWQCLNPKVIFYMLLCRERMLSETCWLTEDQLFRAAPNFPRPSRSIAHTC